jgi:hypothetical protein
MRIRLSRRPDDSHGAAGESAATEEVAPARPAEAAPAPRSSGRRLTRSPEPRARRQSGGSAGARRTAGPVDSLRPVWSDPELDLARRCGGWRPEFILEMGRTSTQEVPR